MTLRRSHSRATRDAGPKVVTSSSGTFSAAKQALNKSSFKASIKDSFRRLPEGWFNREGFGIRLKIGRFRGLGGPGGL